MSPPTTLVRPTGSSKSPPPVLGPELNGIRLIAAEFDAVTEFDRDFHYELIDGVLIVNPIPSPAERDPNGELEFLLRWYKREHPQGKILDRTLGEEHVRIGSQRRRADRVIWAGLGRKPNVKTDLPTIVVEFVSAGRRNAERDYIEKRDEYLAAGVKEYWVFDRFRRLMSVYRQTETGIVEEIIHEHDTYRPSLLPGFDLRLIDLLNCAEE